jgi:two-component system CheB/CheR fusion protein
MARRRTVIAVIDDDPGIREAMRRVLMAYGFEPELYESAEEFIGVAATFDIEIDCALVDLHLPGMSGAVLAVRLIEMGLPLPVVFMSASDDDALVGQAMALSPAALLRKPVSINHLLAAIEKATGSTPETGECH